MTRPGGGLPDWWPRHGRVCPCTEGQGIGDGWVKCRACHTKYNSEGPHIVMLTKEQAEEHDRSLDGGPGVDG